MNEESANSNERKLELTEEQKAIAQYFKDSYKDEMRTKAAYYSLNAMFSLVLIVAIIATGIYGIIYADKITSSPYEHYLEKIQDSVAYSHTQLIK